MADSLPCLTYFWTAPFSSVMSNVGLWILLALGKKSKFQMHRETCWESTVDMTHEKYYHHVCALSHHTHGVWMILRRLSLCSFVTPSLALTSPSALLNNCRWSNISRPFRLMSHTETLAVTQVWVTEHDLPLWVTWQSTSCTMKLQLQEKTCDGNVCQHVPDETTRMTNMIMVLKVKDELHCDASNIYAILFWLVTLLTKSRSLQTVSQVIISLSQHRLRVNSIKENKQCLLLGSKCSFF